MVRVARLSLAVLATTLLTAGCREAAAPREPIRAPAAFVLSQVALDSTPSQLAVAQVVPGFGGYFIDASGRPAVYLADPLQRAAAEQALGAFLASRDFTPADLEVLPARYEYEQLDAWYRLGKAGAFSVAGIVLGDVDEGLNRLRFGVTTPTAAAGVLGALTAFGIPAGAVVIEQRAPIVPNVTLRDYGRPVTGAMQINFFPTPTSLPTVVSLICTIGFNAERYGVRSFITNSHCTNVEGGELAPTEYYQNLRSTGTAGFIGTEVDDPEWTSYLNADCPPPLACRYSDAARVEYAAGVPNTLGRISRVDHVGTSYDDTITTIQGFFTIRAKRLDPVQGEIANKVGRTTGWTMGPTIGTCVDVLAIGTNHIRLCQVEVAGISDHGDSGSPVFWRKGNQSNVTLIGILWGGSVDESAPEFVYSPLSGIERELGALKVY